MLFFTIKAVIGGLIISLTAWLSGRKPELAGLIFSLPIISFVALVFSYIEYKDDAKTITFAKTILMGAPLSWTFFLPFFFADKIGGSFWVCYGLGIVVLLICFSIVKFITGW